jgi:putative PIN family toxin of toxin-antitoxin system
VRVVLDTNVIVSGLIWGGEPRHLLDFARQNTITPYTSAVLLDELADVLARDKFAARLATRNLTPNGIVRGYAALARVIAAPIIARTVPDDPDDDAVIACALAAQADLIVSGDRDLLILHPYQNTAILKPSEAVKRILG